jgi:glyoxylase-like metal-dependent hydrolase (beta-lactamase superfamily II)
MQKNPSLSELSPLVRRIVAPNPSPLTFEGTCTYIIGRGDVAVLDPGPMIDAHITGLLAALEAHGERVHTVLVTHTHRDHAPAAKPLAALTGARLLGAAPFTSPQTQGHPLDDTHARDYAPDTVLEDGDVVEGPSWRLEVVATPGHTANHLAFALPHERALFSGDHVMGWSSSVIIPPDGNMGDYMRSLDKLVGREGDSAYYPGHGEPVLEGRARAAQLLAHRRRRAGEIAALVQQGMHDPDEIVRRLYRTLDPRLMLAAHMTVEAHLHDLASGIGEDQDGLA